VKGWQSIFKEFSETLGKIVEGWKSIFNDFGKFLGGVVEGWKSIFHDLGSAFKSIGKFIFEGLYNGISSMAGKIKDKVTSIANSIKNTFKAALGIHSPSTVFDEYATNTGQGYINGLDKIESPIKQRLLSLANGIKNLGDVKPVFSSLDNAVMGNNTYGNSKGNALSNLGAKLLNFDPKINLYVTVADTGEKGAAKLTDEVKSMAKSSLKNGLVDFFMNDVIRD
jgi:phage-related protein